MNPVAFKNYFQHALNVVPTAYNLAMQTGQGVLNIFTKPDLSKEISLDIEKFSKFFELHRNCVKTVIGTIPKSTQNKKEIFDQLDKDLKRNHHILHNDVSISTLESCESLYQKIFDMLTNKENILTVFAHLHQGGFANMVLYIADEIKGVHFYEKSNTINKCISIDDKTQTITHYYQCNIFVNDLEEPRNFIATYTFRGTTEFNNDKITLNIIKHSNNRINNKEIGVQPIKQIYGYLKSFVIAEQQQPGAQEPGAGMKNIAIENIEKFEQTLQSDKNIYNSYGDFNLTSKTYESQIKKCELGEIFNTIISNAKNGNYIIHNNNIINNKTKFEELLREVSSMSTEETQLDNILMLYPDGRDEITDFIKTTMSISDNSYMFLTDNTLKRITLIKNSIITQYYQANVIDLRYNYYIATVTTRKTTLLNSNCTTIKTIHRNNKNWNVMNQV